MDAKTFGELLQRRIERLQATVGVKRTEYAPDVDVLHNLKRGAELLRCTPQEACLAYCTKHLVSIIDLVKSDRPVSQAVADEKLGDAIVYLVLMEAIWQEGRQ